MRLKLGVASSRVSISTLMLSSSRNKNTPSNGESKIIDNGILEQMLISHHSLPLLILSKIVAHWLLTGVPIILLSPLLGVFL
jgi:hypothetical protein